MDNYLLFYRIRYFAFPQLSNAGFGLGLIREGLMLADGTKARQCWL